MVASFLSFVLLNLQPNINPTMYMMGDAEVEQGWGIEILSMDSANIEAIGEYRGFVVGNVYPGDISDEIVLRGADGRLRVYKADGTLLRGDWEYLPGYLCSRPVLVDIYPEREGLEIVVMIYNLTAKRYELHGFYGMGEEIRGVFNSINEEIRGFKPYGGPVFCKVDVKDDGKYETLLLLRDGEGGVKGWIFNDKGWTKVVDWEFKQPMWVLIKDMDLDNNDEIVIVEPDGNTECYSYVGGEWRRVKVGKKPKPDGGGSYKSKFVIKSERIKKEPPDVEIVWKGKSLKEPKYEDAVRLVRMEEVKKVDRGKFAKLRKKKVDKRLVMGWGEFYHYKQPKITELEVEPEVFVPGEDRLRITYMVEYQYPCDSVKVMIVNEKGRVVKTFESTQNELTTVEWDGRDDAGKNVAPGRYKLVVKVQSPFSEVINIREFTVVRDGEFPYLYTRYGGGFVRDNNVLVTGEKTKMREDCYVIRKPLERRNGRYTIRLVETNEGRAWVDRVRLFKVDLKNGVNFGVTNDGQVMAYREVEVPVYCVDNNRIGYTELVNNRDDRCYVGKDIGWVIAKFEDRKWDAKAVLVEGCSPDMGKLYVQVKGNKGWIDLGTVYLRKEMTGTLVDISGSEFDNDIKVRLLYEGNVRIDRIAVVKLVSGVWVVECPLRRAMSSNREVTELLVKRDTKCVEIGPGEWIELQFGEPVTDVIAINKGKELQIECEQGFVFVATGYCMREEAGEEVFVEKNFGSTLLRFMFECYPNPFGDEVGIRYVIPERARVCVRVYDISGRLVKTLVNQDVNPGYYTIEWEGDDIRGRKVPSGVYFVKIRAGRFADTKKIIRVR